MGILCSLTWGLNTEKSTGHIHCQSLPQTRASPCDNMPNEYQPVKLSSKCFVRHLAALIVNRNLFQLFNLPSRSCSLKCVCCYCLLYELLWLRREPKTTTSILTVDHEYINFYSVFLKHLLVFVWLFDCILECMSLCFDWRSLLCFFLFFIYIFKSVPKITWKLQYTLDEFSSFSSQKLFSWHGCLLMIFKVCVVPHPAPNLITLCGLCTK